MKFKILGMALLALAATSAFVVTNASGTPNGHFYHHAVGTSAAITAHDGKGTAHELNFSRLSPGTHNTTGDSISCKTSQYTGHVTARTTTSIQLHPKYTECATRDANTTPVSVHVNHCSYKFYAQGTRQHGTVEIVCPQGSAIEITDPANGGCTIKIPAQTTAATLTEGISYKNLPDGTITADVTVNTITGFLESGLCAFIGTNQKFEMKGSVTVEGFEYLEGEGTTHTLKHDKKVAITST